MARVEQPRGIRFLLLLLAFLAGDAIAATIYSSRISFQDTVGPSVTDDYRAASYQSPANPNGTFTDTEMSAVLGQTRYQTTGIAQNNIVEHQDGEVFYCGGCNGSFRLDFTATGVSDANGVHGVGFNLVANQLVSPYVAFVTYGDNTTENIALPVRNFQTPWTSTVFWGITSDKGIKTIHFGATNGAPLRGGAFAITNLTVAAVPPDTDADGVPDRFDNCINVKNGPNAPDLGGHSQLDANGDGYGNICDADLNNSGLVTILDYTILRNALNTTNPAADLNGSGRVTILDYTILRNMLNKPPGPSGVVP